MISLSRETEALARRLAEMQSVTVEDAIHQALEAHAKTVVVRAAGYMADASGVAAARQALMERHASAIAAMPILDPRPADAIMDQLNAV